MKIRDRIKEFRRVKASELLPCPRNWRKHPEAQQNALRNILAEVGIADVLLVRETPNGLMLIDGHLRAETDGDVEWPVAVLDVTEKEADLLLASVDPIAEMAEPDPEKLADLLSTLDIESEELKALLEAKAGVDAEPVEGLTDPDEVPEVPDEPVTQPGDLWILGEHRLLCGDSTKAEDVARVMNGERAGLCFTSPPYAQQRDYTEEAKEKVQDWFALMCGVFANLPMANDGQVLVNLGLIHRDCEWVPYWEPWIEWMRQQGWRRFGWYVWDQGPGLPGDWNGRLAPAFEFVFHFNRELLRPAKWVEKKPESIVAPHGTGLRGKDGTMTGWSSPDAFLQTNKIPDSVLRIMRHKARGDECQHAAVFPVELPGFAMQCWPGIVYEPFSGSGTTIIAGEQLGRSVRAIDVSPAYCDIAVQRWEAFTGKQAVLEQRGT